jgi:hypothetical protein
MFWDPGGGGADGKGVSDGSADAREARTVHCA